MYWKAAGKSKKTTCFVSCSHKGLYSLKKQQAVPSMGLDPALFSDVMMMFILSF